MDISHENALLRPSPSPARPGHSARDHRLGSAASALRVLFACCQFDRFELPESNLMSRAVLISSRRPAARGIVACSRRSTASARRGAAASFPGISGEEIRPALASRLLPRSCNSIGRVSPEGHSRLLCAPFSAGESGRSHGGRRARARKVRRKPRSRACGSSRPAKNKQTTVEPQMSPNGLDLVGSDGLF